VKIVKKVRDPPLFTSKQLIKFKKILRNTTQVIVRHRICLQTDGRMDMVKPVYPPHNFVALMSACSRHIWQHVQDTYANMFKTHMLTCSRHLCHLHETCVNMFKTYVNMFKVHLSTTSRLKCQKVQETYVNMFK
jgi:hypothetical protein